jgi:hypothetical protein
MQPEMLPVRQAMRQALNNTGLSMKERIVLEHSPPNLPVPNFTVVMPGLARGCNSRMAPPSLPAISSPRVVARLP